MILNKNLFYKKSPIVGSTYISMLRMINFINLDKYDFNINKKLIYNPSYLLNYTLYLAHKEKYNKSASVFESFMNKSNVPLSLDEKILYSFINFKSKKNIFNFLVQTDINNSELNLIKVIYYLNKSEYDLLSKFLFKGIKENLFLFYIENSKLLFEGEKK